MANSSNENLHAAKTNPNDEFYTQRETVENELSHYEEHFRGKVVYCNCDDPEWSEFWQFFMRNFRPWGLKKLIATHYEPDEKNFAYMLEVCEDTNGDGVGDFRAAACIDLLKEADIVVTNPPFSLFREYIAQLIEYDKKFLIIGNQNALTYKEVFPLLMENRVWLGYHSGHTWFGTPDGYQVPERYLTTDKKKMRSNGYMIDDNGRVWRNLGNICWFTNLDIPKRHQPLDLRGNYYKGHEDEYPKYDNYDAINVSTVNDIPCDYDGIMGVPVTFMDKYCPEQFDIVGGSQYDNTPCRIIKNYTALGYKYFKKDGVTVSGSGALRDKMSPKIPVKGTGDFSVSPDGEYLSAVYQRVFIKRKV